MAHFKDSTYGYITPNAAQMFKTGGGSYSSAKLADLDAIFGGSNYEVMGSPAPNVAFVDDAAGSGGGAPLDTVTTFYTTSDPNGSPSSTTPPAAYEVFAYLHDNGGAFSGHVNLARHSSGFTYAIATGSFSATGAWQGLWSVVPSGNTSFVTSRLSTGDVGVTYNNTSGGPVTYKLDAIGCRYLLLPAAVSGWQVGSVAW